MGTSYNPKIITNNLVALFDAANVKSYPAGQDSYVNSVSLMLDGETLTDKSSSALAMTNNGVTVSSVQYKYGNSSLSFNGSSYIYTTTSSAIVFGTGDFTIEFWIYFNSLSTYNIFDQRSTEPQIAPSLYMTSNTIRYYINGADRITSSALSAQTWYHVAIVRSSGSTKLYINGTQSGSTYTDTNNYVGPNFWLGAYPPNPVANLLNGYIDDFRVTKSAVYTSNFTPPSGPLRLPGIVTDLTKNRALGTISSGITYNSGNGGSLLYNGAASAYVSIPDSTTIRLQNFTISAWVKFAAFSSFNGIICKPQTASGWTSPYLSFNMRINNNGTAFETSIGSVSTYSGTSTAYTFSTNVFYNLVMTYDGATIKGYINGSLITNANVAYTINYTSIPLLLGATGGATGGNTYGENLNGNIYLASIYNRALTVSEVIQNYNATKGRFGL